MAAEAGAAAAGGIGFRPPLNISWLFRASLVTLVGLYVLNQTHILPKVSPALSAAVSKILFWPTLPITAGRRVGEWVTPIDETVVLGGAPFAFLGYPQKLQEEYGVGAVINFCHEWRGPVAEYERLGMLELYLPTTDHVEPSAQDLSKALCFLQECQKRNVRAYVHCRAGHGRSGACALAWRLLQDMQQKRQFGEESEIHDDGDSHEHNEDDILKRLNQGLGMRRKVRSTLWKQPNLLKVWDALKQTKDLSDLQGGDFGCTFTAAAPM